MDSASGEGPRILQVFAERANAGDLLAAEGIKGALGSHRPFVDCELANPPAMSRALRRIDEARDEDLVVIGGGGLFHRYFTPLWRHLADHPPRAAVHVWGVGMVDSKTQDLVAPRGVVRRALDNARTVSVRDDLTADYVGRSVPVIGCPSSVALRRIADPDTPGEGVLLHVMHAELVGPLVEFHAEELRALAARMGLRYRQTDNLLAGGTPAELDELLDLYRSSRVVVSSRLHGCIIAASLSRPVVALSNDYKIDAFMQQAGLAGWCLSIEDTAGLHAGVEDAETQPRSAWVEEAAADNVAHAARVLASEQPDPTPRDAHVSPPAGRSTTLAPPTTELLDSVAGHLGEIRAIHEDLARRQQQIDALQQSRTWRLAAAGQSAWHRVRDVRGVQRAGNWVLERRATVHTAPEIAFEAAFYASQLEALGISPLPADLLEHYRQTGWRLGLDPSPAFSTSGYQSVHLDVFAADMDPFLHYEVHGRAEGRQVVSVREGHVEAIRMAADEVDAGYYLAQVGEADLRGLSPGLHYLAFGWREGLRPNHEFDTDYYMQSNPDVAGTCHPFIHYVRYGRAEGRPAGGAPIRQALHVLSLPTVRYPQDAGAEHVKCAEPRDLAARIVSALDPVASSLVAAIAFDDFDQVVGGTQLCLGVERDQLRARAYDYVSFRPVVPLPSLAPGGSDPALLVKVNDTDLPDPVATSDLGELLEAVAAGSGRPMAAAVVHGLLGHEPGLLGKSLLRATEGPIDFWAHDYYIACASPSLTRNYVAFCGAPSADSGACRCCQFGAVRADHMARMAEFVSDPAVRVTTPSDTARTVLLASAPQALAGKQIDVIPHGRLVPRRTPQPVRERDPEAPLRLAFLGMPVAHKGWYQFLALQAALAPDAGVELWHLGARRAEIGRFAELIQTGRDPHVAHNLLREVGIDAVMLWSTCPETFSFGVHEAIGAGCAVLTSPDSGNVHAVAREHGRAVVYDDESRLLAAARSGDLAADLRTVVERPAADLEFVFTGLMGSRLA